MKLPIHGMPGVLEAILECSWQAAALVPLVLVVQRVLGRRLTPSWRHALWCIVLGRLLLPVTPASPWSLFNLLPSGSAPAHRETPIQALTGTGWNPVVAGGSAAFTPSTDHGTRQARQASRELPTDRPPAPAPNLSPIPALSMGECLAAIWGVGAACLLLRLGLQNRQFARRIRREMQPASDDHVALLRSCQVLMGVRRPVRLLRGEAVGSPALFGILLPRLLLPTQVADTSTPAELRHIFLHELAHLRRGDLLVHGVCRVLIALHWFNPVLAWAFRRSRADRELATDSLALEVAGEQERRAYGMTIVRMLERWVASPERSGTVGILEDDASLERRIQAIADFRRPSRWAPMAAVLIVLLAAVCWTNAQPREARESAAPTSVRAIMANVAFPEASNTPVSRELTSSDSGRRRIQERLEAIRLPEVKFENLPLGTVVHQLKAMAQAPGEMGVNFFVNPYLDMPQPVGTIDPNTGATVVKPAPDPIQIQDAMVRIDPPLRNVTLLDVLHAITLSTTPPVAFTIEEYAVVFFHKRANLLTRVFRGSPDRMANWFGGTVTETNAPGPVGIPSPPAKVQESVREFFRALGFSLTPPNAIFFNDRLGLLMVRATEPEMALVAQALQVIDFIGDTDTDSNHTLVLRHLNGWTLDGLPVSTNDLPRRLQELGAGASPQSLVIRADPDFQMGTLVQIIDTAKAAGFRNLGLGQATTFPEAEARHSSWKTAADLPSKPEDGNRPVLIAFEADWSLESQSTRKEILESPRLRTLFASSGTALFRIDCTLAEKLPESLKLKYGVPQVPGYALYHPARKKWTVITGAITEDSLAGLLGTQQ